MEKAQFYTLVEKAIAGDKAAFAELYQLKATHILYQAQQILKNRADAEDVSQHVALRMYQRIGTLQEPKSFNLWLRKIITNECMRNMKKRRILNDQLNVDDLENSFLEEQEEFLPAEFAEKQELRELLLKIVHELPARQQEAILLYYYENMSTAEIGDAMNISQNTVFAMLYKARNRIKQKLEAKTGKPIDKRYSIGPLAGIPVLRAVFEYDAEQTVAQESVHTFMQTCHRILESNGSFTALSAVARAAQLAWNVRLTGVLSIVAAALLLAASIFLNPTFHADSPQPTGPNSFLHAGGAEDPQPSGLDQTQEDLDIKDPQEESSLDQQPDVEGFGPPAEPSQSGDSGKATPMPPDKTDEDESPSPSAAPTPAPSAPTPSPLPPSAEIALQTIVQGRLEVVGFGGGSAAQFLDGQFTAEILRGDTKLATTQLSGTGDFVFNGLWIRQGGYYTLRLIPLHDRGLDFSPENPDGELEIYLTPGQGFALQKPLLICDDTPPTISLQAMKADGTSASVNPSRIELIIFDATQTACSWSILPLGQDVALASGNEPTIGGDTLDSLPRGRYLVQSAAKDAAGNEGKASITIFITKNKLLFPAKYRIDIHAEVRGDKRLWKNSTKVYA